MAQIATEEMIQEQQRRDEIETTEATERLEQRLRAAWPNAEVVVHWTTFGAVCATGTATFPRAARRGSIFPARVVG